MALGDLPEPSETEHTISKKPYGTVLRRNSDEEVHFHSPAIRRRPHEPGLGMAYETEMTEERDPDRVTDRRRRRESLDDAKKDEYWRGYYDRKRREKEREREISRDRDRESDYYPESHGQHRYIEYGEDRFPTSRAYKPGTLRASKAPVQYRGSRPLSYMSELPVKRYVELDDDGVYADEFIARPPKRGEIPVPPPGRPSLESSDMRIPFTSWMNKTLKGHFIAALGEFVGTTMFLFFAFAGTQVANIGGQDVQGSTTGQATGFSPEVLLYISLIFGFSLMVNVWVFFRISGGLFNPAVTLAMAMTRSITAFRAILLVGVQLAGSIFASFIVKVLFPTEFKVRTTLSLGTSLVSGVFIEAILTFELVFTIFLLAKEKHKATFIAPVGIGLALFIAEMVGVYYTGGSLNPARSFGPCVVSGIFDREHWIYWVGPGAGAMAAVVFYKFIKILEYELANPGQDGASEMEAKHEVDEATAGHKPEETV